MFIPSALRSIELFTPYRRKNSNIFNEFSVFNRLANSIIFPICTGSANTERGEKYRNAKYNAWSRLKIKRERKNGSRMRLLFTYTRSTKQRGKQAHPRLFFPIPSPSFSSFSPSRGFQICGYLLADHGDRAGKSIRQSSSRANSLGTQFAQAIRLVRRDNRPISSSSISRPIETLFHSTFVNFFHTRVTSNSE